MVTPNLLVIRVSDLERSREWYEELGFSFVQEQHGTGPIHYSAERDGFVFELYPASARNPVSASVRLGFTVANARSVAAAKDAAGEVATQPAVDGDVTRALLVDPDGIKVEIVETQEAD